MSRRPTPRIETYNLFGEAGGLPDVVHVETIETRSLLHDWKISAHRHGRLHQVLLVTKGGGVAEIEGERHALSDMRAVNLPMGAVHSFDFVPGTEGFVVTLAGEMLDGALENSAPLRAVLARPAVFGGTQDLRSVIAQLVSEYGGREFPRAQFLRSLSGLLLGLVARLSADAAALPEQAADNDRFKAFEVLLDGHFAERWSVSDYAKEMGITTVHLSRIARGATGKPASALIDERMAREARRHLVYTNLPVSKIAYMLGFSDPAYFSRVFARTTGMPPKAVREQAIRPPA